MVLNWNKIYIMYVIKLETTNDLLPYSSTYILYIICCTYIQKHWTKLYKVSKVEYLSLKDI